MKVQVSTTSLGHFSQRNFLLQSALRPEDPLFPIEAEYPIVLTKTGALFSYSMIQGQDVVAHANLWPRVLEDKRSGQKWAIGLVGNVASHPELRGQGLVRELFSHLTKVAKERGLFGLMLWSDLDEFYPKLGFLPVGKETRFHFAKSDQSSEAIYQVEGISADSLSAHELEAIKALRYDHSVTLERSDHEWRKLLSIPATYVFLLKKNRDICGFIITGKGYDMLNVVHEWGATDPDSLLITVNEAMEILEAAELQLLTPAELASDYDKVLRNSARKVEEHAMAFLNIIRKDTLFEQTVERAFVWGLDGI